MRASNCRSARLQGNLCDRGFMLEVRSVKGEVISRDRQVIERGGMTNVNEETATSTRSGAAGREARRKVPKFTEDDKENFNVYGGDVVLNENKSPLPVGYPRLPLQDITAALRPLNNNSDEEDPNTGVRKPFTRSQGLRKLGQVQTKVLSERISKNVNRGASSRAGLSKSRKKQVIKVVVDESESVTVSGEPGQMQQETVERTINVSSSVKLTEQTQEGQKMEDVVTPVEGTSVKAAEETSASVSTVAVHIAEKDNEVKAMDFSEASVTRTEERKAAPEEQLESNAPSTGTGKQLYQDQKRRKPLSGRSSVSSFR